MPRGHARVTDVLGGRGTASTETLLQRGCSVIVRDFAQAQRLRDRLAATDVHVADLVNNTGTATPVPPWDMEPQTFDCAIPVSRDASYKLSRSLCEAMRADSSGPAVNFASLAAFEPDSGMFACATAEAGVIGYSHSLATDLRPVGVTASVNAGAYMT